MINNNKTQGSRAQILKIKKNYSKLSEADFARVKVFLTYCSDLDVVSSYGASLVTESNVKKV